MSNKVKKLDPKGNIVEVDISEVVFAEACGMTVELEDGTVLPMFRDIPDNEEE